MPRYTPVLNILCILLAAGALAPQPGAAQVIRPVVRGDMTADERADILTRQAVALHPVQHRLLDAARLHQAAARLRAADDPRAVESLATAAHLLGYVDRPLEAKRTMEEAARLARAGGDVVRAAEAYVAAAFLARQWGSEEEVQRLARQAGLLTASPVLTAAERLAIERRLEYAAPVATAVGGGR